MPQHLTRRFAQALVAILALSGLMFVSAPAQADPGWPQDLADVQGHQILSHADGSITAANCNNSSLQYAIKTFSPSGAASGSVLGTYDNMSVCNDARAVGPNGVVYGVDSLSYPTYKVAAYLGNVNSWKTPLTSICTGTGEVLKLIPERLTVGYDGKLYVISRQQGCGNDAHLTKLDSTNGTVLFQKKLGSPGIGWLSAYEDGLVVYSWPQTLRYFEYDGDELSAVSVQESGNSYEAVAAATDGRVFLAINKTPSSNDPCYSSGTYTKYVVGYGLNGKELDYQSSECLLVHSAGATPQYGVVLEGSNGQGERRVVSLDPTGDPYQNVELPVSEGDRDFGSPVNLVTDTSGNVLVIRQYWRDANHRYKGWQFALLEPYGLTRRAVHHTDKVEQELSLDNVQWALSPGRLYLAMSDCTMSGCASWASRYLYAIDFAELGMDYPRGATLGVQAQNLTKNLAALGDSFTAGEGVEPFDAATDIPSGQSQNRCHRSDKAYAKLLDQDPSVGLQLTGFRACSGATTESMFSGQYTEQSQFSVLNANTDVVSLTIGGNDIGFSSFVIQCLFLDCSQPAVEEHFFDEVAGLDDALEEVYDEVHQHAPSAQVYALGYPQLLPASGCSG